jgi:tRNA(Ile)-lysidine synthase
LGVLKQFLNHIERHQLCKTTDKILLAVSGGVDSMVMLDLFQQADFNLGVVHCNFQLRGDDSNADEALVKGYCHENNLPFFMARFPTEAFAADNGLSIQLAARKLRYDFFEQQRSSQGYDRIATAHQFNDTIETVLLNLIRGTGVRGLTGIPVKNEFVIRPLLFATRDQILDHAVLNKVPWREDRSNLEDEYQRNFIRHKIMPLVEELNSNFENTFRQTLDRVAGGVHLIEKYLEIFSASAVEERGDETWISRGNLAAHKYSSVILWELVKSKGFNFDQCNDILAATQSGKRFLSRTHEITIDRDFFIVTKRDAQGMLEVLIEAGQKSATNGREDFYIEEIRNPYSSIDKDHGIGQFDAAKLIFPLRWRPWRDGDSFKPLGMHAHKKVSDLLIDMKIPAPAKGRVTVLESDGTIVWVVGLRVSEDFKITERTERGLSIKVVKSDL